jgi:hypothetical protein
LQALDIGGIFRIITGISGKHLWKC